MISRRSFIKNVSLCSLLLVTGNIRTGLTYTSPKFGIQDHTYEKPIHICVFTVGETGLKVGKNLPRGVCSSPSSHNSKNVIQFNPMQVGLSGFLAKMDLIFILGSSTDKDFWIARELALESKARLIITLIPDEFGSFKSPTVPGLNESIISLQNFTLSAVTVIEDISSILLFSIIIGIDYMDIKEVLKNSYGIAFSIQSSLKKSLEASQRLINRYSSDIKKANGFLVILSYTTPDFTLEEIGNILDALQNMCNDDSQIILGCAYNKHISTHFRLTIVPVISDRQPLKIVHFDQEINEFPLPAFLSKL